MSRFPCKDCTKRHPGCHGECEEYINHKKKHDELMEKKRNDDAVFGYYGGRTEIRNSIIAKRKAGLSGSKTKRMF